MTKQELEHENKVLTQKNELLKLKLEEEEVYHSIKRLKLELELVELKQHIEKTHGNTHAVGFEISSEDYEE